ncbi:hypothetical protein OL548_02740 [Lysinibacillus sp. MHQ-1]|nr:hypothetical protein OL548_02740 [Lysinibacillus sp. MHQ-1]
MVDHEKQELSSVIQQLLKDQLNRRNVQDNSFAFLEKRYIATINWLSCLWGKKIISLNNMNIRSFKQSG